MRCASLLIAAICTSPPPSPSPSPMTSRVRVRHRIRHHPPPSPPPRWTWKPRGHGLCWIQTCHVCRPFETNCEQDNSNSSNIQSADMQQILIQALSRCYTRTQRYPHTNALSTHDDHDHSRYIRTVSTNSCRSNHAQIVMLVDQAESHIVKFCAAACTARNAGPCVTRTQIAT